MTGFLNGTALQAAPELSGLWFWALLAGVVVAMGAAIWRRMPEFFVRGVFLLLVAGLLVNALLRHDERQPLPDKVLVIVDDSNSQKIGGRDAVAEEALEYTKVQLAKLGEDVEPVIVRVPQTTDTRTGESTRLFTVMRESLLSLPLEQVGGAIVITDGQIHDAPTTEAEMGALQKLAPIHVLLTGRRDEYDRKVSVVTAPQYGLIGQTIDVEVRVDEQGREAGGPVQLTVFQGGKQIEGRTVPTGENLRFTLPIEHPGQNVFEFRVPVADGEMTVANNIAPIIVNGVRDRLRVLLVSGVPHMGERAWRNLLKSDPGIDLVHFTILRPPTAMDMTPQNELSLIVFPVDELFHSKIDDFDLIIFDKYQEFNLLSPQYFSNIRAHVRKGGAFLLAMGSDIADDTIFQTALADTLPVTLSAENVFSGAYRPALAQAGEKHPITADLPGQATWGQWYTQANIQASRGETLMTGPDGRPLLVVDQVEEGRVGVIASDNIWLWSKGGHNAGPYSDLLRNLSHWLMKEPELEKDYLKAEARGNIITISQRENGTGPRPVTMTAPSGVATDLMLSEEKNGWMTLEQSVDESGIYTFAAADKKVFVVVGTAQSQEYADVLTTAEAAAVAVHATKGGVIWFGETKEYGVRHVDKDARRMHADTWIGIKKTESYRVTSVKSQPLVENPLFLLVVLGGLLLVWLVESGRRFRR